MTTSPLLPLTAADLPPLAPELVLIGSAFALMILDLFVSNRNKIVTHLFSLAALAVVLFMLATGVGGQGEVFHDLPAPVREALSRGEAVQGGLPEGHHDTGPHERDLVVQVVRAGVDLRGLRPAVARGPALDDVGDEHAAAGNPRLPQCGIEHPARPPHEGQPRGVLVPTGRLPDEEHRGGGGPLPGDRARPRTGQGAERAPPHPPRDSREAHPPGDAGRR